MQRAKQSNHSLASVFKCDNTTKLEPYLTRQVELKKRELERIESPLISAPAFFAECAYLVFLAYSWTAWATLFLYFSQGNLRTNFIRLLTNPLAEQRRLNRWAVQEANRLLESNFNFNQCYGTTNWTVSGVYSSPEEFQVARKKLLFDYQQNIDCLRSILEKGDIIKLHSFTTHWLDRTVTCHCLYTIGSNLFYLVIMFNSLLGDRPTSFEAALRAGLHELTAFRHVIFIILGNVTIGVMVALFLFFEWSDQLEIITRLRALIVGCINKNNELYYGRSEVSRDDTYRQMNDNLLFVLLNYRIFPLKAKHSLTVQSFGATASLSVMFALPIVVRLHAPYCSPDFLVNFVYVCAFVTVVTTMLISMSCNLNDKTVQLHKPLASLLAHLVELNHHSQTGEKSMNVYSRHTVWCFRQELGDLAKFQEPLLPRQTLMNVKFTFPNLIQLQFWQSLLILSIFARTKLNNPLSMSGSDRLLNDPLGLLNDNFLLN